MKPIRISVTIGRRPKRCRHTEQLEGEMCIGCVRRIIDGLLGLVHDAQTSDDEPLAMGLIEQALLRLDTSLAGVTAVMRGQEAERTYLNGLTAAELEQVRVYGYTLPEVARAVELVQELGLEYRIRPRGDDAPDTTTKRRWRR